MMLAYLALFFVIFVSLIIAAQRQLIFPAWIANHWTHDEKYLAEHHSNLCVLEDCRGAAFYEPPKCEDAPTVIYFHGNAETIEYRGQDFIRHVQSINPNFGACVVEYAGYGILRKGGPATFENVVQSVCNIFNHLQLDPCNCVFVGHSIGCAVASEVCARFSTAGKKLILIAPFTTIENVVKDKFIWPLNAIIPCGLLRQNNVSTENALYRLYMREQQEKILILGCLQDEVVPYRHSVLLARRYECAHEALECGHHITLDLRNILQNI